MTNLSARKYLLFIVSGCIVLSISAAQAAGLTRMEQLGKLMYQDKDFSFNSSQSCMTCHHHLAGFADPDNSLDPAVSVVSTGADGVSLGGRNAPTSAYAGFSPILDSSSAPDDPKIYVGGMFWDGRATGHLLGDPLAEQAQGPPLNPAEMNMPDKAAVVQVVRDSNYAALFKKVFGADALDNVDMAYDNIGHAIASYERSGQVQKFTSRFDSGWLTAQEQRGRALFDTNCALCHTSTALSPGVPALFTNYGYANLGLPANPLLAGNPVDLGLGGFLESDYASDEPIIGDADFAAQYGKFKVPTLRNIDRTAPYGHNGIFATLREIVAFHNSRDTEEWPDPEVGENLSNQVGKMGLTDVDIDDIVAFLRSLNDTLKLQP